MEGKKGCSGEKVHVTCGDDTILMMAEGKAEKEK
jgi:hypothetical protein